MATRASFFWRSGARVFALAVLDFWSWRLLNWIQRVDSNHSAFWGEKRHVLRLSSKPSVSSVNKNQSFSFKLKDVLTQTLLVIYLFFFISLFFDRQPSIRLSDSQKGHMSGFEKCKWDVACDLSVILPAHLLAVYQTEDFYQHFSTLDIDRLLNKEKREITADLSLPSCQLLNHPPSGEKLGSNLTTADSLSVSPLWLYEVHIAKKQLKWHSADKHYENWFVSFQPEKRLKILKKKRSWRNNLFNITVSIIRL